MSEWISVDEQLPVYPDTWNYARILVVVTNERLSQHNEVGEAIYSNKQGFVQNRIKINGSVKWWRYLPDPPK